MASNVGYIGSKKNAKERRTGVLHSILMAINSTAKRVYRMLSFDAPNIFKSREWPYY
ncbi:MAG: hypothetical protein R6U89_04270 [Dehalococcoidia bacterium]